MQQIHSARIWDLYVGGSQKGLRKLLTLSVLVSVQLHVAASLHRYTPIFIGLLTDQCGGIWAWMGTAHPQVKLRCI